MWVWIMIAIVIAMVVGPVMMLRPTPGMNLLANMRTHASKLGMNVRIPPRHEDGSPPKGAIYSLPVSEALRKRGDMEAWVLVKHSMTHEIHFFEQWDWQGKGRLAEKAQKSFALWVQTLPSESISQVECNVAGVGVLWNEKARGRTAEEAVDDIYALLKSLVKLLEESG